MPTYQYVCSNPATKHEFEVVQSFSDPSLTECTQCSSPVRKVYGSVGVVFKGSGFYRTDSRGNGKAGDGKPGEGTKAGDGKAGSGGTGSPAGAGSTGGKEKAATSSSGSTGGSSSGGSTAA
ncbi:FmdB family transcriptional regulator [Geodermatophilus sp. YIM 151500]|uniref:FmdB family zinc ribbon protein n=1 Tax=Geodermatophilus sp. YIM 151500 TaxID=2984531 RepID=UPI0021E4EFB1|nr:FmdB family zinc ribbon protein [Geodermatophilus sp. YIM 151500]MCV2489596.1 FmdB family transcriptional regulator [Geodermatophilus sp. YIM 151500]